MEKTFEKALYHYMITNKPVRKSFPRRKEIYYDGEKCEEIAYILSGEIHAINIYPNGKESIFKIIPANCFIGPLLILSTNAFYKACFVAVAPTELLTISKASFMHFVNENTSLVIAYLANRYNQSADALKFKQYKSLQQQICHLLYQWSEKGQLLSFPMRLNITGIATLLSVSRVSVSRIIKKMRESSLILKDKNIITIINLPKFLAFL